MNSVRRQQSRRQVLKWQRDYAIVHRYLHSMNERSESSQMHAPPALDSLYPCNHALVCIIRHLLHACLSLKFRLFDNLQYYLFAEMRGGWNLPHLVQRSISFDMRFPTKRCIDLKMGRNGFCKFWKWGLQHKTRRERLSNTFNGRQELNPLHKNLDQTFF